LLQETTGLELMMLCSGIGRHSPMPAARWRQKPRTSQVRQAFKMPESGAVSTRKNAKHALFKRF
jgi:hypothetical protein